MKKEKIVSIILITIITIITIVYTNNISYSANTNLEGNTSSNTTINTNTSNNSNTQATTKNTTTTNVANTQTKSSTSTKSSNANLKNLGITPNDFSGFKPSVTSYDVSVPNTTDVVQVYATADNAKAKITGTGTVKLQEGKNTAKVTVTAEDSTTKTYSINITRKENSGENTENVQQQYTGEGLSSLNINDLKLSPEFDTTIYEYTIKYIGEDTKLNIQTTTTDPYYTVEVTGNEDLQEGENIVNILVSDPDGNNVAVYQITVKKSLVDEEAILQAKEKQKKIIIAAVGAGIFFIIVTILIIKHKRNKKYGDEYEYDYNDEYEEIDEPNDEEDFRVGKIEDYYEEDDEPKLTKEQAREKFLNGYNSDMYEYEEEEKNTKKRNKHKGKRFK